MGSCTHERHLCLILFGDSKNSLNELRMQKRKALIGNLKIKFLLTYPYIKLNIS